MKSRVPVGYVVEVRGTEVVLNLLDMHRGQLASHSQGVSPVTEIGSLLAVMAGHRVLVVRVSAVAFAEPREAHKYGIGSGTHSGEPLRNLSGLVVGALQRIEGQTEFSNDSLSTPPLGAEAYPLTNIELAAVLGQNGDLKTPIRLGTEVRSGAPLEVGLGQLVSQHVAVLGSSGQGKSGFSAAVLQQIAKLPGARIVIFDVNGEYEQAFPAAEYSAGAVKVTTLGTTGENPFRIPYFALGRFGLSRLLIPSERTQRPALAFALEKLSFVKSIGAGFGLANDNQPSFFDDCRPTGAAQAHARLQQLQSNTAPLAITWAPMRALAALVAESHCIQPFARQSTTGFERNAFNYGNVSPLITRIHRFVEDPMFSAVVDVDGGPGQGGALSWQAESVALTEAIFGAQVESWKVHVVNLRHVAHDLMPFVLGALLELYGYELFRRGQDNKVPTLLVLEEAHHYLRPVGVGEEAASNALAYERLAKEGRKFGLALWLSTQRPSEVSPTVLSQCSNWVCFRLTSDKDLATVLSAGEWADRQDVRRIAGLPRRTAVAFGGGILMPTVFVSQEAVPPPKSADGAFDEWAVPTAVSSSVA